VAHLTDKQLVFQLATALPGEERGTMLAVLGPETARSLLRDQKQSFEIRQNAALAMDAILSGADNQPAATARATPPPSSSPSSLSSSSPPAPTPPPPPPPPTPRVSHYAPSPPTVAAPSPSPAGSDGYVYIGQWDHDNHVWRTHYFESADGIAPPAPQALTNAQLSVPKRTGAVYLRTNFPDDNGNNSPTKGVLHEGTTIVVDKAPLWNFGITDSGFIWAKVTVK
jgi:hypothetical protein